MPTQQGYDYPALLLLFNVMHAAFTLFLGWYARKVAHQKATEGRFECIQNELQECVKNNDLDARLKDINAQCASRGVQLTQLEINATKFRSELQNLPTQNQIDDLQKGMADLVGSLSKTQGRLEGINRAVDLINEFLINQGGKNK
jgi:hypothetical protein